MIVKAKAFAIASLSGPTAWPNRMKVVVYVPRLVVFLWGVQVHGQLVVCTDIVQHVLPSCFVIANPKSFAIASPLRPTTVWG